MFGGARAVADACGARLRFEVLEQRDVPTVIFTSVFGAKRSSGAGKSGGPGGDESDHQQPHRPERSTGLPDIRRVELDQQTGREMGPDVETIIGSSYCRVLSSMADGQHAIFNPSTDWTIDTGYVQWRHHGSPGTLTKTRRFSSS